MDEKSLPETGSSPRANFFAERQISGTRQSLSLPRVTLGEGKRFATCCMLRARPSAKKDSRQSWIFAKNQLSAKFTTLGEASLHVMLCWPFPWPRATRLALGKEYSFAECLPAGSRQRACLPSTCWHHLVILYLFRLQKISSRFSTVFTSS